MARRSNTKFAVTAVGRDQISPAMRKAGQSFVAMARKAAESEKKVSSSMGRARRSMNRMVKSSSILTGAMERIGHRGVDMLGRAIFATAKQMGEAVKAAQEYEKAIAEVQTISDKSVFTTERIKKITSELSREYGSSAQANAKALYQTISAGTTDAEGATKLLHTAAKLSIGGITEMTTSVDGLTNVVNAYSAAGLTAADAADVMFVGVRDGKTTIEELATTLGQVSPIAAQLGVDFSDLTAAVATITTNGVATAEAVTQVRSALVAVAKQTSKSRAAAKALGIDFSLTALKTKGLQRFLREVVIESGATTEQLVQLFGRVEAVAGVMSLTAQNGEKFGQILGDMETRTGSADAAFGRMQRTMSAQTRLFGSLKEQVAITFGAMTSESGPAVKALKGVNDALKRTISFFESDRGKQGIDAFFSLLNKGLIVATDATRSMVRALAALTGSDDLKNAADELYEIHKALELARQGFDSSVSDNFTKTIAQANVEAFQEIIATQNALQTTLKDASLNERVLHLQRIAQLEGEIESRRKVYEESRGGLQGLLDAEKDYARSIMSSTKAVDENTKSTDKNNKSKEKQLAVTGKLRLQSGSAALDRQREKLRQEREAIEMIAAREKSVDAARALHVRQEQDRQKKLQSEYQKTATSVAGSVEQVMGTMLNANSSMEDNLKSTGKLILRMIAQQVAARLQQHIINQTTTKAEIGAGAAKTAVEGASSQAGIPVIGPILAVAASSALFAAMMAFSSKFQAGGMVPGSGRGDIVPAMLEPGEFVVPRELVQAMTQRRPPRTSQAVSEVRQRGDGGDGPRGRPPVVAQMLLPTRQTDFNRMMRDSVHTYGDGGGY